MKFKFTFKFTYNQQRVEADGTIEADDLATAKKDIRFSTGMQFGVPSQVVAITHIEEVK